MSEAGAIAYRVFSSSIARLISKGTRRIMITSSGPGEGKSTIVAKLAENLARSAWLRIAIVDADTFRPTLHKLFQQDYHNGLGDLLIEVCHADLNAETSKQFGLGDWFELILAQSRTGRLQISGGGEEFSITFKKGRVFSISDRNGQRDVALYAHEPEGRAQSGELRSLAQVEKGELDAAVQLELNDLLRRILALPQPQYRFLAVPEAQVSEARSTAGSPFTSFDRFVPGMLADDLNHPFLSRQIPRYLKDTSMENLKILTCGDRTIDLCDFYFARPFLSVIDRLAGSFDVVLIDAPPVAFDTPTSLLAPSMDGVLLVVKADGFDVSVVQRAKTQLARSGANLLGVALNQLDIPTERAYPYYQYSSWRFP